jgi:uncharacterized protein YbaR (Trm112 family)
MEILACTVCKVHVTQDGDWIVCSQCGRRYPVSNGIPNMLEETAIIPNNQTPA